MKIEGHRAGAFPDLPIQPKTLDFHKKVQKRKKNIFESPNCLNPVRVCYKNICEAILIIFVYDGSKGDRRREYTGQTIPSA